MTPRPNSVAKQLSYLFAIIELGSIAWTIILLGLLITLRVGGSSAVRGAWGLDVPLQIHDSGPLRSALYLGQTALPLNRLQANVAIDLRKAAEMVDLLTMPMALVLICKAGVLVSVCDLFRRLFRSAHLREIYTTKNVMLLRRTGITMLLLTVLGLCSQRVAQSRTDEFIRTRISSQGQVSLASEQRPRTGLNWDSPAEWVGLNHPELFVGLVLIGLGEAFRQGVRIREENELTI